MILKIFKADFNEFEDQWFLFFFQRILRKAFSSNLLQSNNELVKVERSSHYLRYLQIIGILVISFSLSFMLRAQPLEYGFELNEFDPFFNYSNSVYSRKWFAVIFRME